MNDKCKDCKKKITDPALLALLPNNANIRLICEKCAPKYEFKGELKKPSAKKKAKVK